MRLVQILNIAVVIILIANLVLFALKKVNLYAFWIIIAIAAIYLFISKKIK